MKRLMQKESSGKMSFKIVYAMEEMPKKITKSIFLAGPTPRSKNVESWRKEALDILNKKGYDGVVFIPEPRNDKWNENYNEQIDWERKFLDASDCIVFWIPRELREDFENIALTTNVEFGLYCKSGKVVAGAPKEAEKNRYLIDLAEKEKITWENKLDKVINNAIKLIGKGAERKGNECKVPLFIWNNEVFKNWYEKQISVGNELRNIKVNYVFIMPKMRLLFLWLCSVEVFIKSENRVKNNEFVMSRTDMSSVVLYYKDKDYNNYLDTKIILVKEFRSPVLNSNEFVYELPGGSSYDKKTPEQVAISEVDEEIGLKINKKLKYIGIRQAVSTMSAHRISLYSLELNDDQFDKIKKLSKTTHGVKEDTEVTYIEIKTIKEIIESDCVDWNNIGMIMTAISK